MKTRISSSITWFYLVLFASCLFVGIDAGKYKSSSSRKTGSSSRKTQSSSSGHAARPAQSTSGTSHSDQAKLSYAGYNSQPNPPKTQQQHIHSPVQASAPALPQTNQAKPIGWNVPNSDAGVQKQTAHHTNSAPYPNQHQPAAAPAYSQYPTSNNGAPPPYSPHGVPPQPYSPHVAPPPYSQHPAPQYPVQSGYAPVGNQYPAGVGGYPAGGAYPAGGGGYNGYPSNGGYAPVGGGFQGQPSVNNYYPQKSSGSGLQNAAIAGIGGLALYGALRPNGGETKTIIIHEDGSKSEAPAAGVGAAVPIHNSENNNSTENNTPTPLAPFPAQAPLAPFSDQTPLAPFPSEPQNNQSVLGNTLQPSQDHTQLAQLPLMSPDNQTILANPMQTVPLNGEVVQSAQIPNNCSSDPNALPNCTNTIVSGNNPASINPISLGSNAQSEAQFATATSGSICANYYLIPVFATFIISMF